MTNIRTGFPFRVAILTAIVVGMALVVSANAPPVFAHAAYDSSTPGDGEVLAEAPTRVDVYFVQQVARADGLPTLVVVNDSGDQVDTGGVLDDDDRTHMFAELENLDDGRYTVLWHTLSADDDEEAQGAFHFYVGSGPTPVPSGSQLPATVAPTPVGSGDDDSEGVPFPALVAGIFGGLIIGSVVGIAVAKRARI